MSSGAKYKLSGTSCEQSFRSLKVGSAKNSPVVYPVLSVASTGLSGAFKNCGTHLSYMSSRSAGSLIFSPPLVRPRATSPTHRLPAP
jgi:hypothetical protein